jgi:hypothetical protein
MNATDKQVAYLNSLLVKSEYTSAVEAVDAYGLGLKGFGSLTTREASEMIDFFKKSPGVETDAYRAAGDKAEADRAMFDRAMAGDLDAKRALGWVA